MQCLLFVKSGLEIDIVTVNTLLKGYAMNAKPKQGLEFAAKLQGLGFQLNEISFGIILRSICM
jgi:hypothetical protein